MGTSESHSALVQPESRYIFPHSREFYIYKLKESLGWVIDPSLTFEALIARVRTIWSDTSRETVIQSLTNMATAVDNQAAGSWYSTPEYRLSEEQQLVLQEALTALVCSAEELPSRERNYADRAISRLSRLLTSDRAWTVVELWFHDKRKFRRSVVIRVLRKSGVPEEYASDVVELYRQSFDRELLKLISFNPPAAAMLTEADVLAALRVPNNDLQIGEHVHRDDDGRYWKMRMIAAYLVGGHQLSESMAIEYPMEFIWAVGRLKHRASLPVLRRVLNHYKNEPEYVWRTRYAFSRMGDESDIEYAWELAMNLVQDTPSH